jgi:hypothetical protein
MGEISSTSNSEPNSRSSPKTGRGRAGLGFLLLLAAAAALLSPLLGGRFLTDDFLILRKIAFLSGPEMPLGEVEERRGLDLLRLAAEQFHAEHDVYRPAVTLVIAAQYLASGVDPTPYHLVNLGLHLLGGCLVFLLARRLFPDTGIEVRLLAPALFLLSPLQIEAATWTAARSDTISWLFGAFALWLRLGPRGTGRGFRSLAIGLALVAVLAKESAIVFPALLFLIDLAARRRGDVKATRPFLVPYFLIGAIYLGGRYLALDGLGLSYAGRTEPVAGTAAFASLARSLGVVFLPLAEGIELGGDGVLLGAQLSLLAGWALVAIGLLRVVLTPKGRPLFGALALLGALAIIPFAMAAGVNEIGPTLVNARGAYTPWAAIALGAGLAMRGLPRPAAAMAAFLLLFPFALASRPTQAQYLEAHQGVEKSLRSMRAAVADTPAHISGLVLIGYREDDYLRGGFTLSGSVECGMMRPFAARDWKVSMVRDDEPRPDRPYLVPFPSLLDRHPDGAIWLHLREGSLRPRVYDRAHLAARPSADSGQVLCLEPALGSRLLIDPAGPGQATEFRWRSDFPPETRWRFRLFSKLARLVDQELPPAIIRREGQEQVALIPWTADSRKFLDWYRHFAWTMVPCDAEGRELSSMPPVFFEMQRP